MSSDRLPERQNGGEGATKVGVLRFGGVEKRVDGHDGSGRPHNMGGAGHAIEFGMREAEEYVIGRVIE